MQNVGFNFCVFKLFINVPRRNCKIIIQASKIIFFFGRNYKIYIPTIQIRCFVCQFIFIPRYLIGSIIIIKINYKNEFFFYCLHPNNLGSVILVLRFNLTRYPTSSSHTPAVLVLFSIVSYHLFSIFLISTFHFPFLTKPNIMLSLSSMELHLIFFVTSSITTESRQRLNAKLGYTYTLTSKPFVIS